MLTDGFRQVFLRNKNRAERPEEARRNDGNESAVDPQGQVRQNRRTMTMGEIRASVTLENSIDREVVYRGHGVEADVRRTTVEGIVDTGAVSLVIPVEIATELGLRHWGTRTVVYADERREERPVTDVTIEIGNLATRTEAIVEPAGSQVLIGQVVLETLDLVADCRNRTLAPRHPEGPVLAIR
jgi:clan AA aspartic protease